MANSPATAYFISKKLYRLFISDIEPAPDDPLLLQCLTAWGSLPGGNIQAVVQTLLSSPRFLDDTKIRWNLERRPLDNIAQTIALFNGRGFDAAATPAINRQRIAHLRFNIEEWGGQDLFRYGPPDGFPRGDYEMLTTNRLVGTTKFRQELYDWFNLGTYPWLTQPGTGNPGIGYDYLNALVGLVDFTNESSLTNYWSLIGFNNDMTLSDGNEIWLFFRTDLTGAMGLTLLQEFLANLPVYIDRATSGLAFVACHTLNNLK